MGTISPNSAPEAQSRGRRFKPGVSVSASLTGSTRLQSLCSPTAETAVSKPAQCECNSHRRHPFNAPVAQSIEHRASNAEAGGESPSGSANSTWIVNRTSVPGLVANEIVLHLRDEEHVLYVPPFPKTLSSNWPRHPTFYRVIAGSNPARVANLHAHVAQQQRHDVESVASAGATPAMSTISVQSLDSEAAGF